MFVMKFINISVSQS